MRAFNMHGLTGDSCSVCLVESTACDYKGKILTRQNNHISYQRAVALSLSSLNRFSHFVCISQFVLLRNFDPALLSCTALRLLNHDK